MEVDSDSLDFHGFYWMGKPIGLGGVDISDGNPVKHTKANAGGIKLERQNSYKVPKSRFNFVESISKLVDKLTETA